MPSLRVQRRFLDSNCNQHKGHPSFWFCYTPVLVVLYKKAPLGQKRGTRGVQTEYFLIVEPKKAHFSKNGLNNYWQSSKGADY